MVEKHRWARSLACFSTLLHANKCDQSLTAELNWFSNYFPDSMNHLGKAAMFLENLSDSEYSIRVGLLIELDVKARHWRDLEWTGQLNREAQFWYESLDRFVINVTPKYVETLVAEEAKLKNAINSGFLDTNEERAEQKNQWDKMIAFLNAQKSDSLIFMKDDKLIVRLVSDYVDKCLGYYPEVRLVADEFQICYWYDRLTVSLVRMKRWEEAYMRLSQLFSLPEVFFGRSSPSELARLRKRFGRCEKQISRR